MAVHLPNTLQTHYGMIISAGRPQERQFLPHIADLQSAGGGSNESPVSLISQDKLTNDIREIRSFANCKQYEPSETLLSVVENYIRNPEKPQTAGEWSDGKKRRIAANLTACTSDVSKEDLKRWIMTKTRFDLEQAAAAVVSAFVQDGRVDDAVRLARKLGRVIATSHMWIDPRYPLPAASTTASMESVARKLRMSAARQKQDIPLAADYHELVKLLMRVRTTRRAPENRCLHIPNWMFNEANIEPCDPFKALSQNGVVAGGDGPMAPVQEDSIIISRRHFRHLQKCLYALNRFWVPGVQLRRDIKKLGDDVLYAHGWIEKHVFQANDIALLCHYFFHFQRRLQKKVVSNMDWTAFMGKGEGKTLFQNNLSMKSTFENALYNIADANEDGIIVAMGADNTLELIDQTCLMMKEYVDTHGAGKTENLTFKKGEHGGSGRGPVDDYNLLCDILSSLRNQAKEEGIVDVPGPTHKFLAKDIMQWNDAWADDAFANGKKAGWEDWLRKRGLADGDDNWGIIEVEKDEKMFMQ
ncbi:hypothetical protein BU24DRAFT_417000 [Aaosphaeria arxii CBS 175.79]|uniref:Uncharacterized protein n=1 Tax=Aaosphaeria arxii CBS 175.79 TaxID=1450172 RepID=A0A6A5Y7R1_9PLEO|nr:uncharacterized protein BU24DRAFT_417000 [Aaosphaeria arxii CBS 175.79]KAF2021336.1 hypothetical protein BU24DRAFT_417000 [Aaosphaeria arxii CBS 175.79]